MTHFHKTTLTKNKLLLAFILGAVIVQACNPGMAAPTRVPTIAPSSTFTPAPSATITPSPFPTPTELPTETPEPTPEIFAGFTENEEALFLLLHRSGEMAATLGTENKSDIRGAVWTSADRESSIVVYSDSGGLPQQAVVGNDTLFFSNHSGNTMHMTVVHADGSEETVPVELDTALLDQLSKIHARSLILVSYSTELPTTDLLDETRELLSTLGLLECLKELKPTPSTLRGLFKTLKAACGGELLKAAIEYGDQFGLNARTLEEVELHIDMALCVYGLLNPSELLSCLDALLLIVKQLRDFAEEANQGEPRWIQHGSFMPELTEPPVVGGALEGVVKEVQAYCRYGPGKAYLPAGDLFQGDRVQIEGRYYASTWLFVKPENLDHHCWAAPSVFEIVGDMSTVGLVPVNLPLTPDAEPVTGLRSSRDGNMVTITWDESDLVSDTHSFRGYLLEVFTCENGAYIWQALNPQENFITLRDDEGCANPSGGVIYTATVRGYSQSAQLSWPE